MEVETSSLTVGTGALVALIDNVGDALTLEEICKGQTTWSTTNDGNSRDCHSVPKYAAKGHREYAGCERMKNGTLDE